MDSGPIHIYTMLLCSDSRAWRLLNSTTLRAMSSGRSNGANGTHVKTTVNMIVAIVFMIKSDEVAVYALSAVYSL